MGGKHRFLAGRRWWHGGVTVLTAVSLGWFHLSGWVLVAVGLLLAPLTGKSVCRWFCPAGCMVELGLSRLAGDGRAKGALQYYKVGCPVAWVGGWLNPVSLIAIHRRSAACTACGACDRACYLAANDSAWSLFRAGTKFAPRAFQCSRCGACVLACSRGVLKFGIIPSKGIDRNGRIC